MNNTKTYCRFDQPNKSQLYIVSYFRGSEVHLEYVYNNISDGFMGVQVHGFVENLRGLLKAVPDFLEEFDHSPEQTLINFGFVKREPTKIELMLYQITKELTV